MISECEAVISHGALAAGTVELTQTLFPLSNETFASTGYCDPTLAEPSPIPVANPETVAPGGSGFPFGATVQLLKERPEEDLDPEQSFDSIGVSKYTTIFEKETDSAFCSRNLP